MNHQVQQVMDDCACNAQDDWDNTDRKTQRANVTYINTLPRDDLNFWDFSSKKLRPRIWWCLYKQLSFCQRIVIVLSHAATPKHCWACTQHSWTSNSLFCRSKNSVTFKLKDRFRALVGGSPHDPWRFRNECFHLWFRWTPLHTVANGVHRVAIYELLLAQCRQLFSNNRPSTLERPRCWKIKCPCASVICKRSFQRTLLKSPMKESNPMVCTTQPWLKTEMSMLLITKICMLKDSWMSIFFKRTSLDRVSPVSIVVVSFERRKSKHVHDSGPCLDTQIDGQRCNKVCACCAWQDGIALSCLIDACEIDVLRHEIDAFSKHHPLCANPRSSQLLFVRASRPSQLVFVHRSRPSQPFQAIHHETLHVLSAIFRTTHQYVRVPSVWIVAPGSRRRILQLFSAIHHDLLVPTFSAIHHDLLVPTFSAIHHDAFVPEFGLTPRTASAWIFCTHQIVLSSDHVNGLFFALFSQLDFQCGQHVRQHVLIHTVFVKPSETLFFVPTFRN